MKLFDILDPQTPILGNHFLEASAGTGKTFAIQHLTARLIEEEGFSLDEILIVTFTRAATCELKTRIRQTLKDKARGVPFDQAQIFTIHGFCYRMLMEYSFEAGEKFPCLNREEYDYYQLLKEQITDFLRTSLSPSKYSTSQLTTLFRKYRQDKDLLIQKIMSIIEKEGELPVYLDFSASYKSYVDHHFAIPLHQASSFRHICDRKGVVKEPWNTQLKLLALSPPSCEEFDSLISFNRSVLSFFTESHLSKKATIDPLPFYQLRRLLLPILEEATSPLCSLIRIGKACKESIRHVFEKKGVFSPDDILKKFVQFFAIPSFLSKIRSRYRAVIIDEFQDTDITQWQIFKRLFVDHPIPVLYLIGDPKQSIYSFRNADIYTYFEAQKTLCNTSYLDTNYRSDPALIHHLNALFSQKPHWLSLPHISLPFHPVKHQEIEDTQFPDTKTAVHFFVYETEKKQEKSWPSPEIEKTTFFPFIINEIEVLKKNGFCFSDFAILVKDRFQAGRLKKFLDAYSIPSSLKSTQPLIATPSYTLLRSLLQAYFDPSEIPVKRFLAHPLQPYSYHDLQDEAFLTRMINTFRATPNLHAALRDLFIPRDLETYSDFIKLTELILEHLDNPLVYLDSLTNALRSPIFDANSVTITTIHMSKGLEFNIVFALGLINRYTGHEKLIRYRRKWFLLNPDHPQYQIALRNQQSEKMRQLYVTLTRAKKRVYVPLLVDTTNTFIPPEQASPLELFQPDLHDATYLTPRSLLPSRPSLPILHSPKAMTCNFSPSYLHSYSSLAQPQLPLPFITEKSELPKGPETGILIHSLLETIFRHHLTDSDILPFLNKNLPPHFPVDMVHTLIYHALHTPLAPHTFTLRDVFPHHIHPEVEFLYPSNGNFIKGAIDLVFSYRNKSYILDWKLHLLPNYSQSALYAVMERHDYMLQSQIYHTALSRYLSPRSVAGAYYIFLRALPHSGIFFLPGDQLEKGK